MNPPGPKRSPMRTRVRCGAPCHCADRMVVAVQGRADLALIDPVKLTVTERIPTLGCSGPHGEALDATEQVMFVACEGNARMVTVDLSRQAVVDDRGVGESPDVVAHDFRAKRVYVAAESGTVSIFDHDRGHLAPRGSGRLADGAHSVSVDPMTHHSHFPIPRGTGGAPELWEFEPTAETAPSVWAQGEMS